MNARTLAIVSLALLTATGCRTNPHRYAAVRNEELRLLEDRIYELEDVVAEYERALAKCRGGAAADKGGPAMTRPSSPATSTGAATTAPPAPPATKEIPRVEMPGLPMAPGKVPERLKSPGRVPPPAGTQPAPRSEDGGATRLRGAWRVGTGSTRVTEITLNQLFTGGYNADGRPGDEGITASIEPRDAEGRLVLAAAPISVVLLDPSRQGETARVARWDFTAEEIAAMSRDTRLSQGIHLAMTWPDKPPANPRLQMFVRYTTADGRKLEVERNIDVDVNAAGRQARRWTPVTPTAPSIAADRAAPTPVRTAPAESPRARQPARVAVRPARPEPVPDKPRRNRPGWSPYR